MRKFSVLVIDFILVAGILVAAFALYWFGFNQGISFSPTELDSSKVLFEFKGAERILLYDNSYLSSPKYYDIFNGQEIVLHKGIYYLGVEYSNRLEVRRFEVRSDFHMKILETEEGVYSVTNFGNDLNVVVQRGGVEQNFLLEGGKSA